VWTHADKARLTQIVHNLVDNAIKFTHQGRIDVRVAWSTQGLEVVVQDTGIGIAPDRQQVIFDRFEHANIQTNRQYGGTGLGMAICERLVALQGGTLGLSSELGSGSRFWFKLPLPQVPAPSMAGVGATDVTQEALQFLVVDDNAVNLMVAGLMLKKHFPNAKLQQADSAAHALELLGAERFDVVLMDMIMPGMDGLESTRILRQNARPAVAQLPVIGLTANTHALDKERCMQSGMNDVLAKPMDILMLKERVDALFTSTKVLRP
jgi:CheY-like chemotaxis protein